jgi:NAD(P)-dependent dehydrogenase (short-subunit alcohol dehydrogenase family)
MLLSGKKALITGARRRIGRGIAQAMAEAGCDVAINDVERDADAEQTLSLIQKTGRKAAFYNANIADPDQVQQMIADFVKQFGRIDILVNNAYASQNKPFLEIDAPTWQRTIDVSLTGFFFCSQAAARCMAQQGEGGSIVSVSSVHARRAWPTDTAYGVAKAGILRLTESMALDLGRYNIRCNAILPGYMDTDHTFGNPAPIVGSLAEQLHANIPLRRRGTPEDIGRTAVFLSSPWAANITGVSVPVDGGLLTCGTP